MTLEPPGSIAVVGAGPLGIEAALYGRFLGYDVQLIEAVSVGQSMQTQRDEPLPMLPNRCLSPLALSALQAQSHEGPPFALPTTIGKWIDEALLALTETDLLSGRLCCPARVTQIDHLPVEPNDDDSIRDEPDSDNMVSPDFRLTIADGEPIDAESVILAVGPSNDIKFGFDVPTPYLFRIGESISETAEEHLLLGLKQIVDIYATLADRESLDLYRPRRGV
ncbi:MAG: hypothetical protein HKN47_19430 [Pirellulaceae bacterium]|nr:hypothetical protein [Pirellulaceae bacterium]